MKYFCAEICNRHEGNTSNIKLANVAVVRIHWAKGISTDWFPNWKFFPSKVDLALWQRNLSKHTKQCRIGICTILLANKMSVQAYHDFWNIIKNSKLGNRKRKRSTNGLNLNNCGFEWQMPKLKLKNAQHVEHNENLYDSMHRKEHGKNLGAHIWMPSIVFIYLGRLVWMQTRVQRIEEFCQWKLSKFRIRIYSNRVFEYASTKLAREIAHAFYNSKTMHIFK